MLRMSCQQAKKPDGEGVKDKKRETRCYVTRKCNLPVLSERCNEPKKKLLMTQVVNRNYFLPTAIKPTYENSNKESIQTG